MDMLPLLPVRNKDELKYYLPPVNENADCNVVTLGIGRDIDAEMAIKRKYPECQFFGADPDEEFSGKMYREELGGTYVKGAISGVDGEFNASIISMFFAKYLTNSQKLISIREISNS